MTSRLTRMYARGVLCIDTPDSPGPDPAEAREPSAELLDRALVGWERFLVSAGESSDG